MAESIGKEFMRLTCYAEMEPSAESRGLPQPPLERPADPSCRRVALPSPQEIQVPSLDLRQAIEQRRSLRRYSPQPLALEELAFLLWCTQGVKKVTPRPATFRTVPSAGARHSLDTCVLANRVTGLEPGLYRYIALEHALVELDGSPDIAGRVQHACLDQGMLGESAASLIWVAVLERMHWRYGERGYRYLHLDAGHVCQNLYLAAEAVGCGAVAIAAYDDELLNQALGLDGENQFAIYAAALGKKPAG